MTTQPCWQVVRTVVTMATMAISRILLAKGWAHWSLQTRFYRQLRQRFLLLLRLTSPTCPTPHRLTRLPPPLFRGCPPSPTLWIAINQATSWPRTRMAPMVRIKTIAEVASRITWVTAKISESFFLIVVGFFSGSDLCSCQWKRVPIRSFYQSGLTCSKKGDLYWPVEHLTFAI